MKSREPISTEICAQTMICESCCAHFADEFLKIESAADKKAASFLKKLLPAFLSLVFQILIVIGNGLFFCVAIWFVPHPESPLKRRQRRLNEAFANKRRVQGQGADFLAAYEHDANEIKKSAEDALALGLAEIRAGSAGQPDYLIRQRENYLRSAVEDHYQSQMNHLNQLWKEALNIQILDEKNADESMRAAHRSAYG